MIKIQRLVVNKLIHNINKMSDEQKEEQTEETPVVEAEVEEEGQTPESAD